MLEDLSELLELESVMSAPEQNAPFGKNLRNTLDLFLTKANSYGLKTGEYDGYCGYAEYGEGKGLIGILCHLDVVPAGNGWSYPPYKLTVDNSNLYGRGVVDNKGSAVIALHILKALKDNNIKLKNRIRIIAGCNEENGSQCLKHYVKYGEIPKFSFAPDADFPIINSEKGILTLDVSIPADDYLTENFIALDAGDRSNVVPDYAKAVIKRGSYLEEAIKKLNGGKLDNGVFSSAFLAQKIIGSGARIDDFSLIVFENNFVLISRGVAGHAMAPEKADNAVHKLMMLLNALKPAKGGENLSAADNLFCNMLSAERLGIACKDDKSGALTINLGVIRYLDGKLNLTLNLRLPLCANHKDIAAKIKAKLPAGGDMKTISFSPNLYVDPASPLIKTLLGVYEKATGEKAYTVQTGGGTYAKELPNSVAFGPTFPGLETNIHNADEHINIERFNKLYEIYYEAVLALDKL